MRIPFRLTVLLLALASSQASAWGCHSLGGGGQASQVGLIEFEVVARQFEFAPSRLGSGHKEMKGSLVVEARQMEKQ